MNEKGAWIAIICILVVGISVTWTMNWFVRDSSDFSRTDAEFFVSKNADDPSVSMTLAGVPGVENEKRRGLMGDMAKKSPDNDLTAAEELREETADSSLEPVVSRPEAIAESENSQEIPEAGGKSGDGGEQASVEGSLISGESAAPEAGEAADQGLMLMSEGSEAAGDSSQAEGTVLESQESGTLTEAESIRSPLETTAAVMASVEFAEPVYSSSELSDRLSRASTQAEQYRKENKGADAAASYLIAEYERNLWEGELNTIYRSIRVKMTDSEAEALKQEDILWISERDREAERAAGKASGQMAQNAAYSASVSAKTEERCYQLLKDYSEIIDREAVPETESASKPGA